MKALCRRCKQSFERDTVIWVPYIEQGITGHIPYCKECYDLLKGMLDDKIQVEK
jgi:NAD-dependent SIR2 family protein deacetylase